MTTTATTRTYCPTCLQETSGVVRTCPDCGGTRMNGWALPCLTCDGSGKVRVTPYRKEKEDAKADAG